MFEIGDIVICIDKEDIPYPLQFVDLELNKPYRIKDFTFRHRQLYLKDFPYFSLSIKRFKKVKKNRQKNKINV